jgi:hypothetical protein
MILWTTAWSVGKAMMRLRPGHVGLDANLVIEKNKHRRRFEE